MPTLSQRVRSGGSTERDRTRRVEAGKDELEGAGRIQKKNTMGFRVGDHKARGCGRRGDDEEYRQSHSS